MISTLFAIVSVALILGAIFAFRVAFRTYLRFRCKSLVACPETRKPAVVHVNAARAGLAALKGGPVHLRLDECSRWLERKPCEQDCLSQIENDPEGCQVLSIVRQWYTGRSCAYCQRPIEKIHWHDHRPALLGPDGNTIQWTEVPAEKLPEMLATHKPVCWSCHMAETFRKEHPYQFVDRPWNRGAMGEYIAEEPEHQRAAKR